MLGCLTVYFADENEFFVGGDDQDFDLGVVRADDGFRCLAGGVFFFVNDDTEVF